VFDYRDFYQKIRNLGGIIMEFNRCGRCGSFYVSTGNVCPKCSTKDGYEFKTFTNYIKENGLNNSLDTISDETGITVQNLNRFLGYDEFKGYKKSLKGKGKSENINITL
jgi:hypothetical protein